MNTEETLRLLEQRIVELEEKAAPPEIPERFRKMSSDKTIDVLRGQAWQRAKGALFEMLEAHRSPDGLSKAQRDEWENRYWVIRKEVVDFIHHFEVEGYHE
jgi:hypothetical protein